MSLLANTRLFVLQPTSFCNLNCSYCYVPDRQNKSRMSDDVLESSIKKLFTEKTEGEIDFLYHAGEPMAVGIDFYKRAIEIINKYKPEKLKVNNVMQTNGVLVNDRWAEFFVQNDFKVGVSIDGPKFLHDSNRKNWNNKGSYDQTLRGFKILKEIGLNPGVLSVITLTHLDYAKELLEFYLENEINNVGFNIEEIENTNTVSSLGRMEELNKDKYSLFMSKVFDFIMKHSDKIKIREFSDILHMLYSRKKDKSYLSNPIEARDLAILTIQKNGDITTYCPEFAGMKSVQYNNFIIGNILTIRKLSDISLNENYLKIRTDYTERKKNCRNTCAYYPVCGSAFLSNLYSEKKNLIDTNNASCILSKQVLTSLVIEKLTNM